MTAVDFRRMALALPETSENAYMAHPDFRVRGKIFATLNYPDANWGMVKLTPEQQKLWVQEEPKVFVPVKGGWGRRGATNLRLAAARKATVLNALRIAWRNTAPKRLVEQFEAK